MSTSNTTTADATSDDKKFRSPEDLQEWLVKGRGVDETKAAKAAPVLFQHEFDTPSTLIGISEQELAMIFPVVSQ